MHQSIATIDSPEFINLQPLEINPLMSSCEIKVLYLGENRNHSYITKEVASEMAKTLRGAPIVGYYKNNEQDFGDHGQRMILDDEGFKFECLTKPYGFVAPDAKVWFQKFKDMDDFGNEIEREYLMTTGYLWSGQYEECKSVIENGKNQSMELDEDSLDGNWSTNSKTGMDFFIINDAIFSKLCILGDDVEPCFEGARVTAPEVSKNFSLDENFKQTLFTMMQELKFALEGGQGMEDENKEEVIVNDVEEKVIENDDNSEKTVLAENEESIEVQSEEEVITTFEESGDSDGSDSEDDSDDEEEIEAQSEEESAPADEENIDTPEEEEVVEEELDNSDDGVKKLQEAYTKLQEEYALLKEENNSLLAFKLEVEDKEKDSLIKSFYMLSEEDKAEVIENKSKYTLDEIEAKLSVICVRKKVNFDLEDKEEVNKEDVLTYTVNSLDGDSTPAWIAAVRNTKNQK